MAATGTPTGEHHTTASKPAAGRGNGRSTAVIIPSLGGPAIAPCLDAVTALDPAPRRVLLVLSGGRSDSPRPPSVELVESRPRLGFAAAVNLAVTHLDDARRDGTIDRVALLNDDALPPRDWLEVLGRALDSDPRLAAVQGTVADREGTVVDGRGIDFDRFGLPVQLDRGHRLDEDHDGFRPVLAVSGTAALFKADALRQAAVEPGAVFDPRFGSYHEDLDLGLRLRRLGWTAQWRGGCITRHTGSSSGLRLRWRHPWWLLANRWRALAGNLTAPALLGSMPRLLRGEIRAMLTLSRTNPRAVPVAFGVMLSLPWLILSGWLRKTPGARLDRIPGS